MQIIDKTLSHKVIMAGNYYKHHHPGGISAVVAYWSEYIENLQYYPTFKEANCVVKLGFFLTSYFRIAWRLCWDRRVEIVHLHTAADGSFWRKVQLIKLAKSFEKKVILHVHASRFKDFYNESSPKKKTWILNYLRRVDVLVCLSESWKEWFKGIGVDDQRIVVLHNITDFPQFKESTSDAQDGRVRFLFMGEIGERKGVFDLLRALSDHKEEVRGRVWLKIGGNKNEDKLRAFLEENQLNDMVDFEGWVSGDKKIDLLNWADVFILPSYNEGLPISILEAMSYKMPIISTPVGGIPEVVETGKNGMLVTPGNTEEIFHSIQFYLDNKDAIQRHGVESSRRAATYLPDYVLSHLKRIYENLIQ
jgi:glycosyltransferase involved in cell wall biosynthesis